MGHSKGKQALRDWLTLVLGCFIMACAYPLFYVPLHIAPGGLTGAATILNVLTGFPVGLGTVAMNLPLFFISYRRFGRRFVLRSLAAMLLSSAFIDILPFGAMTREPLLGAVFGGVLLGVGIGLTIRAGANTGGTDMASILIHRRFPLFTVGGVILALDVVVISVAGVVLSAESALLAFITVFVSSCVIDRVVEGFNTAKAFFIISRRHREISRAITGQMDRGVTLLNARGGYSGQETAVLLCVVTRIQVVQLKNIVHGLDPKAFVIATDVREVIGEGFAEMKL